MRVNGGSYVILVVLLRLGVAGVVVEHVERRRCSEI